PSAAVRRLPVDSWRLASVRLKRHAPDQTKIGRGERCQDPCGDGDDEAPHPDDSVPTSVAVGPDGAYYVGELTGFPIVLDAANIYRIGRAGEPPEACLAGFTQIIDIAFDHHRNLYVLEYTTNPRTQPPSEGMLIRVVPD